MRAVACCLKGALIVNKQDMTYMLNCEEIEQSFGSASWEIANHPLRHLLVENADDPVIELVDHEWVKCSGSA